MQESPLAQDEDKGYFVLVSRHFARSHTRSVATDAELAGVSGLACEQTISLYLCSAVV